MDEFASVKVVEVKTEEVETGKASLLGDHPDGYIQDTYCQTGNQTNEIKVEEGGQFIGTVVQITNVSPLATLQQMATLFGFLGTVVDIRLYPTEEEKQVAVKLCYVKFDSSDVSGVAQHLTNTVFIDKALIVVPLNITDIPEEGESCQLLTSINAFAGLSTTFMSAGPGAAPVSFPTPPIITSPNDPTELDAIKRTVFIESIDEAVTSSQLLAFFSGVGEVKFMRLCKKAEAGKYAFIEFSAVESVMAAMQYNGVIFGGRALKVNYAKSGIKKPDPTQSAGRGGGQRMGPTKQPSRSRSRSPARRSRRSKSRSRSGSRSRKRKSRSKSASRRKRSRSRSKRSRSRDRSSRRKRSRSRSKKRSRSRSSSVSRSKSKKSKRSRSKSRSPRRKKKSRSRSPRKNKRSRSRSADRKKKDNKDKDKKDKDKKGDKDKSSKDKDKSSDKSSSKSKSEDVKKEPDSPKRKRDKEADSPKKKGDE